MNIDKIFYMMSSRNDSNTLKRGIEEAKKIKNFSILILPQLVCESKWVWENCAKVLAYKSDSELLRYYHKLFEWIKDMNWPGADIIWNRLRTVSWMQLEDSFDFCYNIAVQTNDVPWKCALDEFKRDYEMSIITLNDSGY